jgi:hypothetical protein
VLSGRGLCDGLITRREEPCRVCVGLSGCDGEASSMMRPGPLGGCRTIRKVRLLESYETRYIFARRP